jgi:hypothetical protein
MHREILRLPYPFAEIVLLEYSIEDYGIEIYWRRGGYYEKLLEINNFEFAQKALFKIAEHPALYQG